MGAEDFGDIDKMLLLVVNFSERVRSVRLQKIALLIKASVNSKLNYIHNPYYLGGFSDEIEEETTALHEEGYLTHDASGFKLSVDGKKEVQRIIREEPVEAKKIEGIITTLHEFSDRELTALTYKLFPELTDKSVIKESMEKIMDKLPVVELDSK